MIQKLQDLVKEMSMKLPHVLAVAVVAIDDGMSIAQANRREDIETAAASAYLASIVKSNDKAIQLLANDQSLEDILITTNEYHFIIGHIPEQPFFIFVMTSREGWLAQARLLIKDYEAQLIELTSALDI